VFSKNTTANSLMQHRKCCSTSFHTIATLSKTDTNKGDSFWQLF